MMKGSSFTWVIVLVSILGLIFLTAPTIIILIASVSDAASLRFPPEGLSLRWYYALLDSSQLQRAAWTSVKVALSAAMFSVVLGTAASLAIARSSRIWARSLDSFFMSPLILPMVGFGLAFLMMMSVLGVRLSIVTLVIAHIVVCVPFVIRTTSASIQQLDPNLFDSSASLGAGRLFTFWKVTLPLIARGIGAGGFLAFMASFDNVPVSLFVADARTEVLPIRMWHMIEGTLDVRVAAVSGVLVLLTLGLMLLMERVAGLSKQFVSK